MGMKETIADYFRREMELDDDTIQELTGDYVNSMSDFIAQAAACLSSNDFPALRKVGHTIKGTSANVGLEDMRVLGLALEQSAAASDAAGSRDNIEKIASAMEELL